MAGRAIVEQYRKEPKHFVRERVLTFTRVVVALLRGHKLALQNTLNKVFGELGEVDQVPSASAYCQARQKVKPEVFRYLNRVASADYYRLGGTGNGVARWHGRRVVGYDGTLLNVPDTPALREIYGVHSNQYTSFVQAQAGVLYDVLNDIGLEGALGRVGSEQALLQDELWERTQAGDVLVLDRNFRDYALLAKAVQSGRDIVLRCAHNGPSVVRVFWDSPAVEQCVNLPVPQTASTRREVRERQLPESLPVRLVKVLLSTGETEVLLTTLQDAQQFPAQEVAQVYGWRWREETYFGRIKGIFELERFSGTTPQAIQQDFFGVLFLATLEGILVRRPQTQLRTRQTLTPAKVNRALSYVTLLDRVVVLLADPLADTEAVLRELQHLLLTNPTHHRPGRHFPRTPLKHSRRLRFQQYRKRINA